MAARRAGPSVADASDRRCPTGGRGRRGSMPRWRRTTSRPWPTSSTPSTRTRSSRPATPAPRSCGPPGRRRWPPPSKKLRRPTVVAWAVNRLAPASASDDLDALFEQTAAVAAAQEEALGGTGGDRLRAAARARREALGALGVGGARLPGRAGGRQRGRPPGGRGGHPGGGDRRPRGGGGGAPGPPRPRARGAEQLRRPPAGRSPAGRRRIPDGRPPIRWRIVGNGGRAGRKPAGGSATGGRQGKRRPARGGGGRRRRRDGAAEREARRAAAEAEVEAALTGPRRRRPPSTTPSRALDAAEARVGALEEELAGIEARLAEAREAADRAADAVRDAERAVTEARRGRRRRRRPTRPPVALAPPAVRSGRLARRHRPGAAAAPTAVSADVPATSRGSPGRDAPEEPRSDREPGAAPSTLGANRSTAPLALSRRRDRSLRHRRTIAAIKTTR